MVLLSPTRTRYMKVLWDRPCGFTSLSEKTRNSIHLQMSLQRQHFLLSYLKSLSVGPAKVWICDQPPLSRLVLSHWANQVVIKYELSVDISTKCWPRYRSTCQLSAGHMLVECWSSVSHVLTEVSTKCCHGNFVISQVNLRQSSTNARSACKRI